jgi:hypothetical protein
VRFESIVSISSIRLGAGSLFTSTTAIFSYALETDVLPEQYLSELLRYRRQIAAGLGGAVAVTGLIWWIVWLRRPSAEELERRRRGRLGQTGRIVDGMITDVIDVAGEPADSAHPHVVVYRYNIAGVVYECAQDVSALADRMTGFRIDLPVQVKYDPRNPYDSVIVSEEWKGFRSDVGRPAPPDTPAISNPEITKTAS